MASPEQRKFSRVVRKRKRSACKERALRGKKRPAMHKSFIKALIGGVIKLSKHEQGE